MHSALRRAIEKGCLESVRAALDHGAAIEEADMHGAPGLPMRIACFNGHANIVLELIQRGADIHAPNAEGVGGPIRMAARGQHSEVIDLLLAHGAEIPEGVQLPKAISSFKRCSVGCGDTMRSSPRLMATTLMPYFARIFDSTSVLF